MSERYSRQTLFSPIGKEGQVKIRSKHVLIIGAGALGSRECRNAYKSWSGRVNDC